LSSLSFIEEFHRVLTNFIVEIPVLP
jgi:hypothetical protein